MPLPWKGKTDTEEYWKYKHWYEHSDSPKCCHSELCVSELVILMGYPWVKFSWPAPFPARNHTRQCRYGIPANVGMGTYGSHGTEGPVQVWAKIYQKNWSKYIQKNITKPFQNHPSSPLLHHPLQVKQQPLWDHLAWQSPAWRALPSPPYSYRSPLDSTVVL